MGLSSGECTLLRVDHAGQIVHRRAGRICEQRLIRGRPGRGQILRVQQLGNVADGVFQRCVRRLRGATDGNRQYRTTAHATPVRTTLIVAAASLATVEAALEPRPVQSPRRRPSA